MTTQKQWSLQDLDDPQSREYLQALTTADLLDWYFATKTTIDAQEAAFVETMRPINKQKELIEWLVARKLDLESAKSLSSASGRVTKTVRKNYVINDLEAVMNDVLKNDRLHAFKLTPIKEEVETIITELRAAGVDVDCLPGVELRESASLRFTKAR